MLRLILLGVLIIVIWISSVPYLIPKKVKHSFSDAELREVALSKGMRSIPKEYDAFLKLLDSPKNPITKEKVALGKALFFDVNLSKDNRVSCATCHMLSQNPHNKTQFLDDITNPQSKTDCMVCHIKDQSGSDRLSTAIGVNGRTDPYHRNTLTILNTALAKYQMWDASVKESVKSVELMIEDANKMGLSAKEAERKIAKSVYYKKEFQKVFTEGITFENITLAIDAYQKTLLTRSDFDRFLDGNNSAISESAKRGLRNFIELGCKGCHSGRTIGGETIQHFPTRNYNYIINVTGLFSTEYVGRDVASFNFNFKEYHRFPFENVGGFLGKKEEQRFRVPILRNVTKTSPYFHNGAVFDLREAVYIMGKYQLSMELTETQIDEITDFLKSLEGDVVEYEELK